MSRSPTTPKHRSRRRGSGVSLGAQLEVERRVCGLPDRCRMLLYGLDNADNDVDLVFTELPFADVARVAMRDPIVYAAFKRWTDDDR